MSRSSTTSLYLTLILSLLLGLLSPAGTAAESQLRQTFTKRNRVLNNEEEEGEVDSNALAPMPPDDYDVETIRGGNDVVNAIPWYVYINNTATNNQSPICSAVLVHADIAITTASCLVPVIPQYVRVGSLHPNVNGTVLKVEGSATHPDWTNDITGPGNLALLKLNSSLTNTVALVNEDPRKPLTDWDVLFMAGLGTIDGTGYPKTLQGLYTFYIEDCFKVVPFYNPIYHICSEASPQLGACAGDAGSPVVLPGTRELVALTAFGDNTCTRQTVNGNVRISTYASWIKTKICEMSSSPPSSCPKEDDSSCLLTAYQTLTSAYGRMNQTLTSTYGRITSLWGGL